MFVHVETCIQTGYDSCVYFLLNRSDSTSEFNRYRNIEKLKGASRWFRPSFQVGNVSPFTLFTQWVYKWFTTSPSLTFVGLNEQKILCICCTRSSWCVITFSVFESFTDVFRNLYKWMRLIVQISWRQVHTSS